MSFSYDRYDNRRNSSTRRSTLGYWVPLVLTVTTVTAGLAAWVLSTRDDDDSSNDSDADLSYGEGKPPQKPTRPPVGAASGIASDDRSMSQGVTGERSEGDFMTRVSGAVGGAIRRTPSPQQVFDTAKRNLAAGAAAAGAMAGAALSAIREEDKDDAYGDHNRWSEEARRRNVEARSAESRGAVESHTEAFGASLKGESYGGRPGQRRKTVVVVVSADSRVESMHEASHGGYHEEHASILSLVPPIDFATTNFFVLIYAPSLKSRPNSGVQAPPSMGSSYGAISTPGQTPAEELQSLDPQPYTPTATTPALSARDSDKSLYASINAQALRLVERPVQVMPFTTPTGHIHLLRHLSPDLVYITESLSGDRGENVEQVKGWVGQIVVVVGGDGAGLGGLVDTEDEAEGRKGEHHVSKWWESGDIVGLGKGVEVVDGVRFEDDFERRVSGRE
ncbi:hypothetical protein M501DRAFT_924968 [Patellaria atrata CBS 101060]|uniref:Peroxin 22-like protein n=1 Tax=Patellaria atrata CBS 101060 TaxID=1346257 RepID=A0A9P4SJS6_9PEZI|nr:hypothetical protein M501DRAFT_924968 [Patellaria atrata CBS 101060]